MALKVLIIGSGGREHALCWKISQSRLVDTVFCAPGNGGIAADAVCVDLQVDDLVGLTKFAKDNRVDLTVVGPEAPLAQGIVDLFQAEKLAVFGPDKRAAQLEGSKAFAKTVMRDLGIPTADFGVFDDAGRARDFIRTAPYPLVVKADGLAAGKGVLVTDDKDEALGAVDSIMVDQAFGDAGKTVVVEERLEGEEASFIAITDGEHIVPLASSQDHKRVFDHDQGPNTGGMGAYSPAPVVDDVIFGQVMYKILYPLVEGLRKQGIVYKGVLYAGLMITDKGPSVLEFNVRLGDPETQPLLMRLKTDIVPLLMEVAQGGSIKGMQLEWSGPSVCVVMSSGGYPGDYPKGYPITGIAEADAMPGVKVFHAGTKIKDGALVTSGGRVLGVTALGEDMPVTISQAYRAAARILFQGAHYRKDIGGRALERGCE
ncbi:MAG: phosphoribosylamine--glycine ligase [Syntrophaceae bacterium]